MQGNNIQPQWNFTPPCNFFPWDTVRTVDKFGEDTWLSGASLSSMVEASVLSNFFERSLAEPYQLPKGKTWFVTLKGMLPAHSETNWLAVNLKLLWGMKKENMFVHASRLWTFSGPGVLD